MNIVKAFSRSIFWRGLYFVSVLLLNILIARHFKADVSGQLYYVTSFFAFIILLLSLCMEAPMGYYLSQNKINETQLSVLSIVWIALLSIPVYLAVKWFVGNNTVPFSNTVFEISANAFLIGNLLITFFVALFYAKYDFIIPNLVLIAVNFLLILLIPNNTITSEWVKDEQYICVYFIGFFLQGLSLAISFILKYWKWKNVRIISNDLLKQFFSFALISVATNAITFLMYRIDYWFVNRYCSPSDLGNYIQACKLGQIFFIVPSILASVVFPVTASGSRKDMNEKMQLLSRILIISYGIFCLFLLLTGYWLFPFVFGPTFKNMFTPFALMIPAILSYSVVHLLAAYYGGKRHLSINFRASVLTLVIIIVGDVVVIPFWGIWGAALISSIGYTACLLYMFRVHSKQYESRLKDFLVFNKNDWQLFCKLLSEKGLLNKSTEI